MIAAIPQNLTGDALAAAINDRIRQINLALGAVQTSNAASAGAPGAWRTITLLNGWAAYGLGYETPAYRLEADGVTVRTRGAIKGGTITTGTTIFIFAPGYWPPATAALTAAGVSSGTPPTCQLEVDASGNAKIYGVVSNGFLALDGVTFPTT